MATTSHAKCNKCGGNRHKNSRLNLCWACWKALKPQVRENWRRIKDRRRLRDRVAADIRRPDSFVVEPLPSGEPIPELAPPDPAPSGREQFDEWLIQAQAKLPPMTEGLPTHLKQADLDEILKLYGDTAVTTAEISATYRIDQGLLSRLVVENGQLLRRQRPGFLSEVQQRAQVKRDAKRAERFPIAGLSQAEQERQILRLYTDTPAPTNRILDFFGIGAARLRALTHKAGVQTRSKGTFRETTPGHIEVIRGQAEWVAAAPDASPTPDVRLNGHAPETALAAVTPPTESEHVTMRALKDAVQMAQDLQAELDDLRANQARPVGIVRTTEGQWWVTAIARRQIMVKASSLVEAAEVAREQLGTDFEIDEVRRA